MTTEKLADAERDVLALNVLALDDAIENAEKRGLSSFVAGLKAILHLAQPAVEKRAPVQGYRGGIPWSMHLEAYDAYCKRWSKQEALITGGCRGGFGTGELDMLIPGWREELSERSQMIARIVDLAAQVKVLESKLAERGPFVMFDNGDKAFVDSWTGGNHDLGHFGGVTLRFVPVEGDAVVRGYQAIDTIKGRLTPDSEWVKTIRHEVMFQSKATHNFTFSRDEVIELLGGKFIAMDTAVQDAKTPAARWRATGEPDPHGTHYDGERAALTLGSLTDDELANGVFMNGDKPLDIERSLAHDPEYHPPIAWRTAARERIRWLSRSLVKADVNAKRFKALRDLCGFVENGTDGVVTIFQDDATREWVVKIDKKGYYGPTMPHALDAAIEGEGDKKNG